jgi:putative membrane protein
MKRFNLNEFIWFILLSGLTIYITKLIFLGQIHYYVHPKMNKFIIFSIIALFTLTVHQFKKVFSLIDRKKVKSGFLIFLLPLLLGTAVAPQNLSLDIAENKGIVLTGSDIEINDTYRTRFSNLDNIIDEDIIIFESGMYHRIVETIANNLERFIGKKVIIEGFVFKDGNFSDEEFVVARMLMTCCAADAQVIGLLCSWEASIDIDREQWVILEGVIDIKNYIDDSGISHKMPIILVDNLQLIDQPTNTYIYP